MSEGVRIDKWLWAVRLFKTRSQATIACKSGKVRIDGQIVKPSRAVKAGETIEISQHSITRSVKAIGFPDNRVGAPLVSLYLEDLTPEDEYTRVKMMREHNFEYRDPGAGRPTKRQRREIEVLKKYLKE